MFIKTLRLLSSWVGCALIGAAVTMSCSNDDLLQNAKESHRVVEDSMTFSGVSQEEAPTRTIIYDHTKGSGASVIWRNTDKILVKDNAGQWRQSATATFPIASKKSNAVFTVAGSYTSPTHAVVYTNKGLTGSQPQVEIKKVQTQTAPNNFDHAGESGDCGVATAQKVGSDYKFTLEHKASFICLIPRSSNTYVQHSKIIKIEISSEDDIAGVYNIASDGTLTLASGGSKTITLTTGSGFAIDNTTADMSKNASYAVIAPGRHSLRIRYWLRNTADNPKGSIDGTVTKYVTLTFVPGSIHDVTANLSINDYGGTNYYMWDAKKSYWYQYEWNSANKFQPVLDLTSDSHYPQNNLDERWYRENSAVPFTRADFSAKDCPNINEMLWYCMNGNPHWDESQAWISMGHLFKTGMWFKKSNYISGFSDSNYGSEDYRTSTIPWNRFENTAINIGTPTNKNEYFFLPSLGACGGGVSSGAAFNLGVFYAIGVSGHYFNPTKRKVGAL